MISKVTRVRALGFPAASTDTILMPGLRATIRSASDLKASCPPLRPAVSPALLMSAT
jgi:hypothetical protein